MYTYIFKSRILILDLKCPWECQVEDQSPRCKTDILIYQTMTQHFAFLDMFEEKRNISRQTSQYKTPTLQYTNV